MKNKKVWLVTGASKGLGLSLVNLLLKQGHSVAATSRNKQALVKAVGANENFLPLEMDIVNEKSVQEGVQQILNQFGHIDVVVNNAGYGLIGSLEELSDAEVRADFDANVFGSLNIIRTVMPHLRQQQSGHIFNISSIGGFTGDFPGWGIYCATKFAMAGFTESLAQEVKDFNVKVTLILPGYFRTNFLSSGSLVVPANPIAAYEAVRQSQDFHQTTMDQNQQGDPEKAAQVMIDVANEEKAPLYLFLGNDAYEIAQKKLAFIQNEVEEWKEYTVSTSYETAAV
jgi:NAD(P)-dependent dehydrogenase (short-subunit alcohol dehydrogenase family)